MPRSLEDIEKEALCLAQQDRAALARRLLATLDDGEDGDVEPAWVAEAERRYEAYRAGRTGAEPADEAIKKARRELG